MGWPPGLHHKPPKDLHPPQEPAPEAVVEPAQKTNREVPQEPPPPSKEKEKPKEGNIILQAIEQDVATPTISPTTIFPKPELTSDPQPTSEPEPISEPEATSEPASEPTQEPTRQQEPPVLSSPPTVTLEEIAPQTESTLEPENPPTDAPPLKLAPDILEKQHKELQDKPLEPEKNETTSEIPQSNPNPKPEEPKQNP